MTSFPITYIVIIIWLIFVSYNTPDYWTRWLMKLFGVLLGIWTGIMTFNGEFWLVIYEQTDTLTLNQFKDGFQLPLALFILGASMTLLIMLAFSVIQQDWKKQPGVTTEQN